MPRCRNASAPWRSLPWAVLAVALTGLPLPLLAAGEAPSAPPETPKLVEAARRGWLRARIVSGRITFAATRLGSMNDAATNGGREERLRARIARGEFALSYELFTPEEELLVEAAGPDQLHIRRAPKEGSEGVLVEFRQPAEGPLLLTIGPEKQQKTYEAASLWHLLIVHPAPCRRHLVPLLQILDQQWDLHQMAEQVKSALVGAAAEGDLPDPRRWATLVEQLGDERFARRRAADRELRRLGRVVYAYLQRLDAGRLDAEQHYRIRRILTDLADRMENDTPPEIARWLAGDPAIWLALLGDDDLATRKLAAERLRALLGEPVRFDPAADAETRQKQIDRLRARLLPTACSVSRFGLYS